MGNQCLPYSHLFLNCVCVCVCVCVCDCLQPTLLILCVCVCVSLFTANPSYTLCVCHRLQLALRFCVCFPSLQSYLTVCDPVDRSLPGSSVHGIFLARRLDWVAISLSILYPVSGKLCPEGLSLCFACWRYLTVGLSCSLDKLAPAEKNRPLL